MFVISEANYPLTRHLVGEEDAKRHKQGVVTTGDMAGDMVLDDQVDKVISLLKRKGVWRLMAPQSSSSYILVTSTLRVLSQNVNGLHTKSQFRKGSYFG